MQHTRHSLLLLSWVLIMPGGCSLGLAPRPVASPGRLDGLAWSRDKLRERDSGTPDAHPASPSEKRPSSPARLVAIERDLPLERRIVIYTAELALVVRDIEPAIASATDIAQDLGGYMQRRGETSITLRIPAAKFDDALKRFEGLGTVGSRQIEGTDVTEEYVDLEARIRAAEAVRDRLLTLLAKADKVEAALAVEKELGRVNADLESLKARLEIIRNRVAYSTIMLNLSRVTRAPADPNPVLRLPFEWLDDLDLGRLVGQRRLSPGVRRIDE